YKFERSGPLTRDLVLFFWRIVMTPIYDELLDEFRNEPDTTFVLGVVEIQEKMTIGGGGIRSHEYLTVGIGWNEEPWWNYSLTSKMQLTNYTMEPFSGVVLVPVSPSPRPRTT